MSREHAVKTDQMQKRMRHQRGKALHELSGDISMWVVPSIESQHDLAFAFALGPFVGNRRAGNQRRRRSSRLLQSILMFASLITLPSLAISDFIVLPNCSGELPTISTRAFANFSLTSG